MIRRLFPILVLVAALSLVALHVSGSSLARAWHVRLGAVAVGAVLAVHGLAFASLRATARRVDAVAQSSSMPGWVQAQAEKNRRKASAYGIWVVAMAGLLVGSGWVGGGWSHRVVSASLLAFQVGASVGLTVLLTTQSRLSRDVQGWAQPVPLASDS